VNAGAEDAETRRGGRGPFFLELHIPKGFKSCVLKMRILRALESYFRNCAF
jgi:hypothetical protein